jgi:hypothetical protein
LGAGQNESLKYQKKEAGDKRNLSKKKDLICLLQRSENFSTMDLGLKMSS